MLTCGQLLFENMLFGVGAMNYEWLFFSDTDIDFSLFEIVHAFVEFSLVFTVLFNN